MSRALGLLLVSLGLLFLAAQTGIVSVGLGQLWPAFVLIPGVAFELSFLAGKRRTGAGLLVPGGILTVIGLLFCFETATSWRFTEYTWPVYPAAVAFGLFQLYLALRPRARGLLVPVCILVAVPAIAWGTMFFGHLLAWALSGPIVGIALVVLGAVLLLRRR